MSADKSITIGIWVYTEPSRLQRTIESIHKHTPAPYSLVLLPDGPDSATAAALSQHHDVPQLGTGHALGAPACFNRLISYDRAKIVVFLESGVLVTSSWLEHLVEALDADPCHGLAGPSTNIAWNEQRLSDAPNAVAATEVIEDYATQVAHCHRGVYHSLEPLYSLSDFCYVVKREVIEAIGGSDEQYALGPCWEMDYNIRAARAGFKGIWVCGAYVHRSPLTARRRDEERRLIVENKRLYQRKFCRLQFENTGRAYAAHCEGDTCVYFAPKDLIPLRLPLADAKQPVHLTPSQHTVQVAQPAFRPAHLTRTEDPLVSCIMPTHNRRAFVSQAIHYFLRQDYPHRELIIVDDGTDPVQDLVPDDLRVRYLRQEHQRTVGAKRNLACNAARGEIILHWDDDDWMAEWRISYQVAHLLREQTDICGLDRLLHYNPSLDRAWEYVYPDRNRLWLAGGTFCYLKAFWQGNPFLNLNVGEDLHFVWSNRPKRLTTLHDNTFYVALIHSGNTSPKRTAEARWHSYPTEHIRTLLGKDLAFYSGHLPDKAQSQYGRERTAQTHEDVADSCPLVSCIMPTYNRRLFVPQAIQYFLRQDCPHKELVIVDDGSDAVADLIPPHAQLRYIRLKQRVSIGMKRNMAVEQSKGSIIMHWDDDDWYAANRISYQVEPLLEKKAEVCGLETGFIYDMLEDSFWSCDADLHAMMFYANIHGGSITYTRELWEKYAKYPNASLAEDANFLRGVSSKAHITKLPNRNVFIYLRHSSNAWEFICGNFIKPSAWKRIPPPAFFRDDLQFYHDALAKLLLDSDTHKAKGDSFRRARHYEEALRCYERAVELDPTNVWAWYDRGQTLEKLGQYDKALQAVREADRLLPSHDGNRTWIHSELGTLFLLLGDKQQAKSQFETALQYNAKNHIARDGMRRL